MIEVCAHHVIAGDEALAAFRQGLTGERAMELLAQANGRLLVQLPVGIGKTEWLVRIIDHVLATDVHDLVVVLVPRWDVLRELHQRLPAGVSPVVLKPRPRKRCGSLDPAWAIYEQTGCGLLGREQLCGVCPRRGSCRWPRQYGKALRGARLIFATQQHLALNPAFLYQLCYQAGASNPLVLLDESNFLIRSTERIIGHADLERFIAAQRAVIISIDKPNRKAQRWLECCQLVAQAPTEDLRGGDWDFPQVDPHWAIRVQREGRNCFGNSFHFLASTLHHFARSDVYSRERLPDRGLRFAPLPRLGKTFIIFSGSMVKELARYRLDPDHARPALFSPFERHQFEHPETRWYNIGGREGSACYFSGNAPRIIDFFSTLIVRNIQQGKRTLLVSRKKLIPRCLALLRESLPALGAAGVGVITGDWARHDLEDPRTTLPLINYGTVGINRFEQFDAAYCLNSYFVPAEVVTQGVQDLEATTDRYPTRIETVGDPPRRVARVELPTVSQPITPHIAQWVLDQLEADTIVQAVGRTRPFTRPREIITLHAGSLPDVRYFRQFRSLAEARQFFNVQTPAEASLACRREEAIRLHICGMSHREIAAALNVSLPTVKRYLRGGGQGSRSI